ncbi:nucleotidyltransferase family protein [Betaproteobacteria bacterium]|nr:nucleotidyltransferase family protein [Betaproteobacteria bacterium]
MNAMILAAGRGKRLMPLTKHIPKPLVRINGKPLLAHHLEKLHAAGIVDVFINVSYLGHLIVEEFGCSYKGLKISYSFEPSSPLETAGGIAFARPWTLSNQPFLVINSDILCDWPLSKALKISSSKVLDEKLAYLVLTRNQSYSGDFHLVGKTVVNKLNNYIGTNNYKLTFTGIGIYKPQFFQHIKRGTFGKLKDILIPAVENGLVIGELHQGVWEDIGTTERFDDAKSKYERKGGKALD